MLTENTIHLGDCLDLMRLIPDKSIDLVLTDPPYGIGVDGQHESSGTHGGRKSYEFKGWDLKPPSQEYFDEIFRISKNQIIWGGNYFTENLPAKMGWIVWDKGQRICNSDGELAFTSFDKALRIVTFNRVELMLDKSFHPTQKPLKLFQWCLERYSQPSDLILDPFSGSGTTAIAAHNLGRRFICIEKDEDYHAASVQRLKDTQAQLRLF
jgi:site-specific DNA-methyltransferase (adenine-specific)